MMFSSITYPYASKNLLYIIKMLPGSCSGDLIKCRGVWVGIEYM